ncbi:MAG: TetR/AcrR family transcriptional regulator [Verrucomicrobiota bacterium]
MKQTFDLFWKENNLKDVAVLETPTETQERLLDAAEQLFAEKGFEAVSLRELTTVAGANLAAVNYHFGGKENLIGAVMARHVVPINVERVRRLDAILERRKKPTVREVLEAFLAPMTERILEREERQRLFAQFMGRLMGEGACGLPEELVPEFQEMAAKVVKALRLASPKLGEEEAFFRMKFAFSVMADAMIRDEVFEQISKGRLSKWDWTHRYEEVLNFCVGGMKG